MSIDLTKDLECDHGGAALIKCDFEDAYVIVAGVSYWVRREDGTPASVLLSHIPEFKVRNVKTNRDKASAIVENVLHDDMCISWPSRIVDELVDAGLLVKD